jgi:GNAT superfamily N-acetyltransferase
MIRKCKPEEADKILAIINDAAMAYKGVIPADCWHEPYMSAEDFKKEIFYGVQFYVYVDNNELIGVIGLQQFNYVALVRHAYVLTSHQGNGIGGQLLEFIKTVNDKALLVGTWRDTARSIKFYEKHGFKIVTDAEKKRLLARYWIISDSHRNNSVVLGDKKWFATEYPK